MSNVDELAININHLTKSFEQDGGSKKVIIDLSLEIKKNQIFGLLGQNGAGKTTLIYILSGLLQADKGVLKVLGCDPEKQRIELAKKINICSGNSLFFYIFTAREILKYYGLLYGMSEKDIETKSNQLIKELGIEKFANDQFHELSTGMKQKVALAKALINSPELLFLDEPTLGLDVEVAKNIRQYLKNLVLKEKMTIVLTSHYLSEVEELCNDIAIIHHGKIIAKGNVEQITTSANVDTTMIAKFEKILGDTKFIEKISGVRSVIVNESEAIIYISGGPSTVERILIALKDKKVVLSHVEVRKATLEEAFLRLIRSEE
ncbi:ABC transporter ATP-binding protein [archaeon]|nr:ABC transporter ATP-binding protein [Nanoarchaeota archaeon]MBU4300826.1 ABC transporter ATP-binding protein [Nanoarchaeota archaeon]MBU4451501.1 ABC transporter ATP-binding protein [Nanoarchaeota archaeon]MCG2723848.1 ABC transporter ATP-binding protein [archaeon]